MSTSFYPPYLLARACSTADSIAGGRFGWNIVSSAEDRAAQNFGLDKLYEHDERYNMADEYFELVNQLWDSWEPDAVVMDRETHTYADYRKVGDLYLPFHETMYQNGQKFADRDYTERKINVDVKSEIFAKPDK